MFFLTISHHGNDLQVLEKVFMKVRGLVGAVKVDYYLEDHPQLLISG